MNNREGGNTDTRQKPPPPHRRQDRQQERREATSIGAETEAQEVEEDDDEVDRNIATPRGAQAEVVHVGGDVPSTRRKTQTYLTLPKNVCTCCCGESMKTTLIATMGRT